MNIQYIDIGIIPDLRIIIKMMSDNLLILVFKATNAR